MTIKQLETRLTKILSGSITLETMRRANRIARILAKATGRDHQAILEAAAA